ncbi:MAG: hypothetical protein ACP5MI_10935 [Candidatus Kryptoniota bacterium]
MRSRSLLVFCIAILSIALYSCSNNSAPTAPRIQNPGLAVSINGYGYTLDSTYYKVWSDSSYETYLMDTTINGTNYRVLLDNSGYQYFYGPKGYSGFLPYGGSLVMFDSALASLPDTMLEGQVYTRQTTFTVQGVNYVLADQDVILDTTTVSVPFGTFSNCVVLQSTSSITGGGQTMGGTTVYWLAKGPSDIYRQYDTGYSIYMAYGVVNRIGWGVPVGKNLPWTQLPQYATTSGPKRPISTLSQGGFNIQSIGPYILNSMIPRPRSAFRGR